MLTSITLSERFVNKSFAGVIESVKEFFCGKDYPVRIIKGKLTFSTTRYGTIDEDGSSSWGIYVLNESKVVKIRDNAIWSRWSPNGKKIVCGIAKIYKNDIISVIDNETLKERIVLIKKPDYLYKAPRFSKDEKEIFFISDIYFGSKIKYNPCNIFSITETGENLRQITFFKNVNQSISDFDISPDGKKIVFTSLSKWNDLNSNAAIYMMDIDGSNLNKISDNTTSHLKKK